jgi:hypothetical protein
LDIYQYYVSLDQANSQGYVTFELEYDQLTAYNMTSLSVEQWANLQQRISDNDTWQQLYQKYEFVSSASTLRWVEEKM